MSVFDEIEHWGDLGEPHPFSGNLGLTTFVKGRPVNWQFPP